MTVHPIELRLSNDLLESHAGLGPALRLQRYVLVLRANGFSFALCA